MTTILTRGASCCSPNKGAASMVLSALQSLKQLIPDADFTMLTPFPNCYHDSHRCKVHQIRQVDTREHPLKGVYRTLCGTLWFLSQRYFHLNAKPLLRERLLSEYAKADILIDLSGDSISDDYGVLQSIYVFSALLPAILLGKAVVIYPQSIGPFKSILSRSMARFVFNRAKFIMAREEITKDYLGKIGIKAPVYLVPDISFLLPAASDEVIQEILRIENIGESNRPLIGMSLSQSIARYAKCEEKYNWYLETMARATDYLIDKLGAMVIFVPHVLGPGNVNDDRVMGKQVLNKVKNKDRVLCITNEYQPEELRGLIGQCDLFIGARMHANISALAMCVPTIAISYSHKTPGIMKMVGMENMHLDFRNMSFEQLISKTDEAWRDRGEIRKKLEFDVPILKEQALLSGNLVKELLNSIGEEKK